MIPTLPMYLFDYSWAGIVSLLVAVVLPLVAALISKEAWSSTVKGLVLLLVAAVKSVAEAFLAGPGTFDAPQVIYTVGINFGIAVLAYFGFLRGSSPQQAALQSLNK